MNKPLAVSELNNQIKSLLESTFVSVCVEGEISNLTHHKSGHIYFSLKDKESVISAVLFKGNAAYLKFRLEEGMKVIVYGSITVYTPRGNYQLLCSKLEPSGIGSLALAFEQLKAKLQTEGLFDTKNKKLLPKYPKKIAIVTSQTGAAIEDMKKVAQKRWPLAKLVLVPTIVQGETAKFDIVSSIKFADSLNANLMIVGRGGGSIEDLWGFNEEIVARAIFDAKTPIISAVGHESDVVISDFVADIRAATPSNAMEIATPDINEIMITFDTMTTNFNRYFKTILFSNLQKLEFLKKSFMQNSVASKFNMNQEILNSLKANLKSYIKNILNQKTIELKMLKENIMFNNPSKKLQTGYAQITKNGAIIEFDDINIDDIVQITTPKTIFETKIINKQFY